MSVQTPACLEWPSLRAAILAGGGIGPSPDWPRAWIPGDLYRRHGKAPDLVAAETHPWSTQWGNGDDARMFSHLHAAYAEWQRFRAASAERWADVYQLASEHGLAVRTVWLVVADAGLRAYRQAGNRRTLFEREAFGSAIEASPRAPRRKRARIVDEMAA